MESCKDFLFKPDTIILLFNDRPAQALLQCRLCRGTEVQTSHANSRIWGPSKSPDECSWWISPQCCSSHASKRDLRWRGGSRYCPHWKSRIPLSSSMECLNVVLTDTIDFRSDVLHVQYNDYTQLYITHSQFQCTQLYITEPFSDHWLSYHMRKDIFSSSVQLINNNLEHHWSC